ncbi:MAG: hypothetical protein Q7S86_03965 [bacterium]|nr:hypothetical protein [bacterium]
MGFVQVLYYYIIWHYTRAWPDMFRVIGNYLWFVSNFFSLELLARSLFSPWRRLAISGGKGKEDSFFGALAVNTLMRLVGFGIRAVTIIAGIIALIVTIVVGCLVAIVWLLFPGVVFFLLFAGFGYVVQII